MLTQVSNLCNARNVVSGEMRETQQAKDDNRAGKIKKEKSATQTINTLVHRSALATQRADSLNELRSLYSAGTS